MAAKHSNNELLLPAAVSAVLPQQQQEFCAPDPVCESDAQPTKPFHHHPGAPRQEKEIMVQSQCHQQLHAGVAQVSGAGFSFTAMLGSHPVVNDMAGSTWDDELFLDHEDMEVLFGMDALDALPAPAESPHTSPALVGGIGSTSTSSYTTQPVSSSDSRAGGAVNVDAAPPTKVQITKSASIGGVPAITGRKRMKRHDEVALLREEAPKLQAQLDMLREYWRQESVRVVQRSSSKQQTINNSNVQDHRGSTDVVEPKWKTLAAQSREDLIASEKQHEWLKVQFQLQKKALQHIRKLIRKRVVSAQNLERQLDRFFQLDPQQIRICSTSMFQFLLADSDAMFQSFEKVQMNASLRKTEDEGELRYWELQHTSESGTFVEMVERFVVPFDRSQVVKALQSLYGKSEEGERVYEFLSSSDDTIMTQFIAGFANSNGSGRVRTQYAARISEDETTESTRFLVTGLIDRLTDSGESRNLVRLREQTWMLVTSCESSAPRHPLSVIQKYYTMAPEVTGEFHLDYLWDTKIIQKVLIPTLDLSMDQLQRKLESELVNLGTKSRRPNVRIEPECSE